MEEKKDAVDQKDQKAATDQEVKKEEGSGASTEQKDDLAAQLAAKDLELKKLAEERDNYKTGLLKAKGKLPEDEPSGDDQQLSVDEKIQKAVHDALFSEKERKLMAEKDAILQQALKENKELKTALGNKQGMPTVPDGGSADTKVTTPQYFSDEQIRDLKARGWDDAKIKKAAENMQRRG